MAQVQVGGFTYSVGPLNAFEQFHVARRIMPILGRLGVSANMIERFGKKADGDDMLALMPLVFEQVAAMDQADADYVLHTCLAKCSRQQDTSWAPVLSASKSLMFADIDMPAMLQIVMASLQQNLASFFQAPPPSTPPAAS